MGVTDCSIKGTSIHGLVPQMDEPTNKICGRQKLGRVTAGRLTVSTREMR